MAEQVYDDVQPSDIVYRDEHRKVWRSGEPTAGGAHAQYAVAAPGMECRISFQPGTIPQVGVEGWTNEACLAVVIDRLRAFQAGPFACREDALALTKCEEALMWLEKRSADRAARGVEGQHVA